MSRINSNLPTAAAAIAAAAVIAACGSSSSGSTGTTGSSGSSSSQAHLTDAQAQQDAVRFADCMRSHGVASFPDPNSPVAFKQAFSSSAAQAPGFQSAATACRHLLPGGGPSSQSPPPSPAQIAGRLAFARCLRSHGFPSFPDPTSTGDITHEMLANAGIDVHSPAVIRAADTCVSVTHGQLTRADVARFAAGQ